MNGKSSKVHQETIKIFEESKKINKIKGRKISRELKKIRKHRNNADYDATYNASNSFDFVKARTDLVFEYLNEL